MTKKEKINKEAEALVRSVLTKFNQQADDDTVREVAAKVARAVRTDETETEAHGEPNRRDAMLCD